MKAIELTQEHKDKLLEMCKALFPDYNIFYFRIDSKSSTIYPKDDYIDNNILRIGKFGKLDLSIHWFEFCITHLQAKLYDEITKISNIGIDKWNHKLIGRVYFHVFRSSVKQGHPIDYLYDEFKKLVAPQNQGVE